MKSFLDGSRFLAPCQWNAFAAVRRVYYYCAGAAEAGGPAARRAAGRPPWGTLEESTGARAGIAL